MQHQLFKAGPTLPRTVPTPQAPLHALSRPTHRRQARCLAKGDEEFVSSKEEKVTDILEGAIPGEEPEEEVEEVPDTSSPIVAEERLDEEPESPVVNVKARMSAAQIYESDLWDPQSARSIRPLEKEERPVWMKGDGSLDPLELRFHLQSKYFLKKDFEKYTSGETALKCGDEVQIVFKVWEKIIEPTNNSWRVGQFRERIGRWQGVIAKIEQEEEAKTRIHVKAFYARVPINKIFAVHHPNIESIKIVGYEPDWDAKWNDMTNRKMSAMVVR